MPVSDSFLEYVLEQLRGGGREITQRRMFGAVGIYADEWFVALVDDDCLYLKADQLTREAYLAEGMRPFQPYGDGRNSMNYFEVPPRVLEDREELARWVGRSQEAAARSGKKKKKGGA